MSQDFKYTNDGKKVIIVGKLNSQETIVQEVFVSGGNEIPSGENFVVKSLHDAPAISWKEKSLKDLESRYETNRNKYDILIREQDIKYRHANKNFRLLMQNIKAVSENITDESFDTIVDFLSGKITHIVKSTYSNYLIVPFSEAISTDKKDRCDDHLKLISLFGRSDGDLQWRLNQYSDGSGSSHHIYPCSSYEEAVNVIESLVIDKIKERGKCSEEMIKAKENYNLSVPTDEQIKLFYAERVKTLQVIIEKNEANVAKDKQKLESLKVLA